MRTNIEIDDQLMTEAMATTGLNKKDTVEKALRLLLQIDGQVKALDELRGIGWEGDLDEMRRGRTFDSAA